jgi:hypothetical protein
MIRLTLYGRTDCHLCHEMATVVDAVLGERGEAGRIVLEVVDVDTDPALVARFGERVPVLCVNGAPAFEARVDARALRVRLAREPE